MPVNTLSLPPHPGADPATVTAEEISAQIRVEADEFDVILQSVGARKIQVIKVVRELIPGMGLKEAKDLVEAAPRPLLQSVGRGAADKAKAALEHEGAAATVKRRRV